jgi:predicted HicB family RNase H-like nuclease
MKKQQPAEKAKPTDDVVKATVRMSREAWIAARHAALDKGISFGRFVEEALMNYSADLSADMPPRTRMKP